MNKGKALLIAEGQWYWPLNSRRAHFYTPDNRSVCGKWAVIAMADIPPSKIKEGFGSPRSKDDCASCRARVDAAAVLLDKLEFG